MRSIPYFLSGYGGGPDRCVVKVPDTVPGKIPKPASISGKMTKSMVSYEEVASDPTAVWRIATAANHKTDKVQHQRGDFQKVMAGIRESLNRMEIMLQKIVYSQRNTTEPALGRSTPEGNFKYPSTGFSVVATGWENPDEVCVKNDARFEDGTVVSKPEGVEFTIKEDLDCAVLEDFGIPSWMFELSLPTPDPIQEPTLVKQWPQSPKEYLSQPHCKYQPRQWNPNFSNERVHNFYKSLEPLEWNQQNETNLAVVNNPDEAKFDLAQLYVVGRADKRLRCTGLFWKLPPWPGFCTMNYDRITQHSDYKVLVNSHSVKQYNHIHSVLDYTDKFKELVKIWPFVNEAASDTLEDTIKCAIDYSITWPVRKVIPIISGDYNELELKSVGTLVVNLMQARELTNKDADIQSVTVKIYDNYGIQEYELLVSGGTQQVVRVWDPGRSKNMRWHSSPLGVGGGLTFDVVLAAGRAQTLPKIHHCYFIRLTLEYCKFSSLDSYEFHACKFNNPKHRHYVILSKKIISASVVMNSTVSRSKKYFNDESVPALEMKIKKLMPMKDESRRLTDWMEKGVYDALQKKYIKTLLFCICEKGEGLMIEEYSFSFSYPNTNGEEVAINFSRTGSKRSGATFKSNAAEVTSDQMRSSACKMNRMLVSLMWTLDQIPEERTILMLAAKLLYAEDSLISNAVSEKAAEASEDLGLVGTPRIDGTTALSNTRIQAGGFSMGQVMQEAEPLFSGAYEGLCLYSSRLLYPIWELLVIVVRGLIVSGDRGDGVETQNLVAQTATEQLFGVKMTKWFDTNYHLIVPELGPSTKFSYSSHKAVNDYKEVIAELKAAGVSWIQFDVLTLVFDLDFLQLAAFSIAYTEFESALSGLNVLVETYTADIPAESYKILTSFNIITAYDFDLVCGTITLDLVKSVAFPFGKYLFDGVVDGHNIWADGLAASLGIIQSLESIVGKDKLVVSTYCSFMHMAVDLVNETKLDTEIKPWLAFAAQKVVEVNTFAKALADQKDEAYFVANVVVQPSRRSSPRVTNEDAQKAAAVLKCSDHRRATDTSARLDAQQKKLNIPVLHTTSIGSFPQIVELRRVRREYKVNKISEEEYISAIKEGINMAVEIQEELDIEVFLHGEPERNDMVEYFGKQLSGFAFTANGWAQSYRSRCVELPIICGDVSLSNTMTMFWSKTAQSLTSRPMKEMFTSLGFLMKALEGKYAAKGEGMSGPAIV